MFAMKRLFICNMPMMSLVLLLFQLNYTNACFSSLWKVMVSDKVSFSKYPSFEKVLFALICLL